MSYNVIRFKAKSALMKLLYCHDNFYLKNEDETVYSAGQFAYKYWEPFLNNFDQLTVVGRAFPKTNSYRKHNVSSGDQVSFELCPNINTPLGLIKYRTQVSNHLAKLVAQSDAVIIRAVSDIGWLAYCHAKRMNKPIAMEMAACAWDSTWNHGNLAGKIYAPIRYIRDKIITKNADYVLYVTKNFLQNRYPTKAQTTNISNVRLHKIDDAFMDIRIRRIKDEFETDKPCIIGLIGSMGNKIKGIEDTLKALSIVHKKMPHSFIFRQLGPGDSAPYKKLAKKYGIEDIVHFDGMLQTGDKVFEWLKGIDLYLQPSYQEGLPRATIEAMSLGCPVIGSTAGGIPELIDNKWLIAPGNVKHLAHLIIKMTRSLEDQIEASGHNVTNSLSYSHQILEPRRQNFWEAFSNFSRQNKKMTLKSSSKDCVSK